MAAAKTLARAREIGDAMDRELSDPCDHGMPEKFDCGVCTMKINEEHIAPLLEEQERLLRENGEWRAACEGIPNASPVSLRTAIREARDLIPALRQRAEAAEAEAAKLREERDALERELHGACPVNHDTVDDHDCGESILAKVSDMNAALDRSFKSEVALERTIAAEREKSVRMERALMRLGDMEAFDVARTVEMPQDRELLARIDYARAALSPAPAQDVKPESDWGVPDVPMQFDEVEEAIDDDAGEGEPRG